MVDFGRLALLAVLLVVGHAGAAFPRVARDDSVLDEFIQEEGTLEVETTSEMTTTTTKQKKVNCGNQNFERTADECCVLPAIDLFPMETTQKECNKKLDKKADTLLNGVMLNRLQNSRKNNQLDYSGSILGRLFGPGVCFADCVFKSNKLMTPSGDIDFDKTLKFITKGKPDPWKSILTEGMAMCKNFTDGTTVKEITFRENRKEKTCKLESVHVVQCLQAVIALNCPEGLPADHDKHKKCTESVDKLQTCVGHIDKNIERTEFLKKYLAKKKSSDSLTN